MENVIPEEWEMSKIEASKRIVITLEREEIIIEIAEKLIALGFDADLIMQVTGLDKLEVQKLREKG